MWLAAGQLPMQTQGLEFPLDFPFTSRHGAANGQQRSLTLSDDEEGFHDQHSDSVILDTVQRALGAWQSFVQFLLPTDKATQRFTSWCDKNCVPIVTVASCVGQFECCAHLHLMLSVLFATYMV